MTRFTFGAAAAAFALAIPAVTAAQQLPTPIIAVVDTTRIYEQCTACVAANQQLQVQLQQIQQRAEQLGQPLQTEMQSLQQAVDAARGQPDPTLQQRITTFQGQQQAAQQELESRNEQFRRNAMFVRQQIDQRLDAIIPVVMQQRGATIALPREATLAISSQVDVTDAVLAALNQQLPSVNINAPPPQQQPAQQQPAQQQRPRGR